MGSGQAYQYTDERYQELAKLHREQVMSNELYTDDGDIRGDVARDPLLLAKQLQFLQAKERIVYYRGGIRSGKTFIGAWASIIACLKGDVVLGLSPTYQMLQDNVIATLIMICEDNMITYEYNQSKKTFKIGNQGGYLIFRTGEKPDAIRGFACTHIWIDESDFFKNDDAYKRAIGRMSLSTADNMKIWLTSSPNGKTWCYHLAKAQEDDCLLITQKIEDNYFLDRAFIANLRAQYSGDFAKQELDAAVVNFSGAYFDTDKIKILKRKHYGSINIVHMCKAFDLGFTANKNSDYSAVAFCAVDVDENFYVINVEKWKTKIPETKRKVIEQCQSAPEIDHYIEANGTQVSVYDTIVDEAHVPNLAPIRSVNSGKITRNFPYANKMGCGQVYFLEGDWNEDVLNEHDEFTMDDSHSHDDQVDAISHCYNNLISGGLTQTLKLSI